MLLYNQHPAPENQGLRLKPVWEPEGATAYAGTPAFILGGAASLGQVGTSPFCPAPLSSPSTNTSVPSPPTAIQLAKLAGHNPIITTASPHNAALLKSLGATHVLDRALPNADVLAALPGLTGGKPLEFAFAAVAADPDVLRLARDALAPGGALAIIVPGPQRVPEDVANPGDGKRVGYVFGSARLPHTRETGVMLFKQLSGWLAKGQMKVRVFECEGAMGG